MSGRWTGGEVFMPTGPRPTGEPYTRPAEFDKAVRKLAEGADILIYDAQYLPEEYEARRRGWGHSHWREAVNVVMESGAKELILFHHDPEHTDMVIDKVVHEARNYYSKVRAAAEGMEITLKQPEPATSKLTLKSR